MLRMCLSRLYSVLKVLLKTSVLTFDRWKETVEDRLHQLETAQIVQSTFASTTTQANAFETDAGPGITGSHDDYSNAQTENQHNQDATLDLSCSLGAFPASSIKSLPTPNASTTSPSSDQTVHRILPETNILVHFNFYRHHLDRYLHHILSEEDTIALISARSPVLLNAICTTAAFCTGSADYHPCLTLLKESVSRLLFATVYHFDDVRALCIAALWIKEISAACHGLGEYTKANPRPNHF